MAKEVLGNFMHNTLFFGKKVIINQKFINFLSGMSGEYWSALGFYGPNRDAIISLIKEVDKEIRIREK